MRRTGRKRRGCCDGSSRTQSRDRGVRRPGRSTALQERMDPESVRAVMQRYYALVRHVIEERAGRLVKFIGDGAMAVFGVPETGEDDALRALGAALALHDAFGLLAGEVGRDRGLAISLRVGVNTGEVVVRADDDD